MRPPRCVSGSASVPTVAGIGLSSARAPLTCTMLSLMPASATYRARVWLAKALISSVCE